MRRPPRWGEHVYGIGRSFNSFAFIQFGMGLGAGFVLNGALYPGARKKKTPAKSGTL